jgi:N-acetylneuraminic acid mutarotase
MVLQDIETAEVKPASEAKEPDWQRPAIAALGIWAIISLFVMAFLANALFQTQSDVAEMKERLASQPDAKPAAKPEAFITHGKVDSAKSSVSVFMGAGSWHQQAPLPVKTSDLQAVAAGRQIFLLGGWDANTNTLQTVTAYDPITQLYAAKQPMPTTRSQFGAAVLSDAAGKAVKIVVAGGVATGGDIDALKATHIYDIATDAWAAGPDTAFEHMDTCMASSGAAVFLIAGWANFYDDTTANVERFAGSGQWGAVASLPEARGDVACSAMGGKIYVVGGYHDHTMAWDATIGFKDTMFVYDVASNAWSTRASMSFVRGDLQLVARPEAGSLLAIGGEIFSADHGGEGEHKDKIASHYVEEYYPDKDQWELRAPIDTARFRFGAAASGWGVHVFGGSPVCADSYACGGLQMDSHEVFFELDHPDIWVNF